MIFTHQYVNLGGIVVDLMDQEHAVDLISQQCRSQDPQQMPLSVVSANIDHVVQFGTGGRWEYVLGDSLAPSSMLRRHSAEELAGESHSMRWLTLLDGAPMVAQANKVTGRTWPRLAGSDLIKPILDAAEREGFSVGFLGGSPQVQQQLASCLPRERPGLKISGFWSPERHQLEDSSASRLLAAEIREADTDILIVGLGKPRQELWMASYGDLTGAKVLLAFGAVVDFLAGAVKRAPRWVSDNGFEWAWRLSMEPHRLAQRYLLDGPPGLLKIKQAKEPVAVQAANGPRSLPILDYAKPKFTPGTFVPAGSPATVTVLTVTYNNADSIEELLKTLRSEAQELALRVVVSDNGSMDNTLQLLNKHDDVVVLANDANLGYAGGINMARPFVGESEAVLILNPDLTVEAGAIGALLERMRQTRAGIVVPRLLDSEHETYQSIRREPSLSGALGDALFGERLAARPTWMSEIDFNRESYAHPHRIHWATGAALLLRADVDRQLGAWDEQFFLYSEETDYFHRARQSGYTVWYEPSAVMTHQMGGSGSSTSLNALMAVNRVRYARKHQSARYAQNFHKIVALHQALRWNLPTHQGLFATVANESRWNSLPAGTQPHPCRSNFPGGTVIIPAHNESAVLARTLAPLAPLAQAGLIEVIVACNGCTDDTAKIARGFPGVKVVESQIPSKVAALNLADKLTDNYPRLYLDADIEITVSALRLTFEYLSRPGSISARPAFDYDVTGASWPVRAYYRARRRIPATNQALWGAGAYGMSRSGRSRFGLFPQITADDLFVDRLFSASEKQVIPTVPVKVKTPRNLPALVGILRRNYRGQEELADTAALSSSSAQSFRQLLASIAGPTSGVDALVYTAITSIARTGKQNSGKKHLGWERDDSSRTPKLAA